MKALLKAGGGRRWGEEIGTLEGHGN
jgi:hypothetical protein